MCAVDLSIISCSRTLITLQIEFEIKIQAGIVLRNQRLWN